jgi:Skp family chaperone for outer membrane proteins
MRAKTMIAVVSCVGLWSSVAFAQGPGVAPPVRMAAAFPVDARVAYVDVDRVAAFSAEGRAASASLDALRARKAADLQDRSKKLETLQQKLNVGASVLNAAAAAALQREFQRAQVDLRRASADAQGDNDDARQETMQAVSAKLFPIIGEVAREKRIWAVFGADSGLAWHDPATDLTEEVARRLDAAASKQ